MLWGCDVAVGTEGSRTVHGYRWLHKSKQQLREQAGAAQPLLQEESCFPVISHAEGALEGSSFSAAQHDFGWGEQRMRDLTL